MKYYLYHKIGLHDEQIIYIGSFEECSKLEDKLRKEIKDRTIEDFFIVSEKEDIQNKLNSKIYKLYDKYVKENERVYELKNGKKYDKTYLEFKDDIMNFLGVVYDEN